MPEPTFEQLLSKQLRAHAEGGVRGIDPHAIAMATVATGRSSLGGRWQLVWSARRAPIVVALLLLALAAIAIFVGGQMLRSRPFVSQPLPSTTPSAVPLEALEKPPESLHRTWVADLPADLTFDGDAGPRRMSLLFNPDGTAAAVRVSAIPRLSASIAAPDSTTIRFVTTTPGGAINREGAALAACSVGDQGLYRWSVSPDGFILRLTPIDETCEARAAIIGRAWAQSLGGDSLGDRGVVDAFAPEFAVTLPHGSFATTRTSDAIEIWAADESVGLLAWKNPQGFLDPCDASGGRFDIAVGDEAFVAYLRQHKGITVVSTTALTVDGLPATRVVIEARTDHPCPRGWVDLWQPAAESSDLAWHLEPGVRDDLYVIDRPNATVMLEVLPLGATAHASIIASVTFLDEVPPGP